MKELRDRDTAFVDPIASLRRALRDRYEIERQIGQGAFATVYLARDLKHERKVAIKVLTADPTSEMGELRFIREIRTVARLQHPNILPLHDSGHVEALLYYVMPYVSGETLRDKISRERQLSPESACNIARDIADALAYAHAQGVIHRDIKPENILMSTGHPIVADFGIARAIDLAGVRQLTQTGAQSPGTPAYMSPEQLLGEAGVDGRSDTYSLGCVLYEMLTGKPPFAGKEGFVKRFTEAPPSVLLARKDLPAALDEVLGRAMARNPGDRYQTPQDFVSALCSPVSLAEPKPLHNGAHAERAGDANEPLLAGDAESRASRNRKWINLRAWPSILAANPRLTTIVALTAVVGALAIAAWSDERLRSAVGFGSAIDSTRVVFLPLSGSASSTERAQLSDATYASLAEWRGLNLVSDQDVNEAIRKSGSPSSTEDAAAIARELHAGRFIWGQVSGGVRGARLQMFATNSATPLRAVLVRPDLNSAAVSIATKQLLSVADRPVDAEGGDGRTSSYPAWNSYGYAHLAIRNGDLAGAENFLRASIADDAEFGPAHVWLARVLAWKNPGSRQEWREEVAQALRAPSGLSAKDGSLASALNRMAARDYPEACAEYARLVATDADDFAGLYGLGECRAYDSLVIRSASSPSGWRFRSRYSEAAAAFVKALAINPNALSTPSFEQMKELLPMSTTKTRRGRSADGQEFAAYPALLGDSSVFIPYPLTQFAGLTAKETATAQNAAISRNLGVMLELTSDWTRRSPQSSLAFRALSEVLEASGEISSSKSAGISAIDAIRKARAFAVNERDTLQAAVGEARLMFKQGEFARARAVADSVLSRPTFPTKETARMTIGLAGLTGKIGKVTELTRLAPEYAADVASFPTPVLDAASAYFAFAAFGVCGDATAALEKNLDEQIAHYVAEDQVDAVSFAVKSRPRSMLAPCTQGKSSLGLTGRAGRILKLQQAYAQSDITALRAALSSIKSDSRTQRPGDVSLDFNYQLAWLELAVGDTAGAVRLLDRTLGSLAGLSSNSLNEAAAAAAAGRAMALRAELAAARGEADVRMKWSRAVLELWATADEPLHAVLDRMRMLSSATYRQQS